MKIVVLDGYTLNPGDNPWDPVAALGDLEVYDRTAPDQVVARSLSAEILLTNKTPLGAEVLAQLPALRFISVLATGYNVVDIDACRARGVTVSNVPEYSTDSVAQHVFALLLELALQTRRHSDLVGRGAWTQAEDFCFWGSPLTELRGLTMGIIGFGRIGRRVGELAHAFGMAVMTAGSSSATDPGYRPFSRRSIEEVFAEADVVSLHCPLTSTNAGFVNASLLARMKRSAWLINTARGGLVDEAALAAALHEGRLAGAGLDVLSTEPPAADHPLLKAPRLLVTPHIAWATLAARRRLMARTAENVAAFLAGAPIHRVGEPPRA